MRTYEENMTPMYATGQPQGGLLNRALYEQSALHGGVLGNGLAYGLPQTPNAHSMPNKPNMATFNHACGAMPVHNSPVAASVALASPTMWMTSPQLNPIPGHGNMQQQGVYLVHNGVIYTPTGVGPYATLQAQGNIHPVSAPPFRRNIRRPEHLTFVNDVGRMPFTPPAGGYAPQPEFSASDMPSLDERQVSIGSHSDGDHPSSPETLDALKPNQAEQGITVIRADLSYNQAPQSPYHYLPSFEQVQVGKPLPLQQSTDLLHGLGAGAVIPHAVPAVSSRKTLQESFDNPSGTTNVYIRGLHPDTTDSMLLAYASRFGRVETSKAMIDGQTGACKGFGFACFGTMEEAHNCIRGFYLLGYEVSFARESLKARLKSHGDPNSTNLYVSNLPRSMAEPELKALFEGYNVQSTRIIRDVHGYSKGVGFARFATRDECDEVIKKYHGQPVGQERLLLQVRYSDTPEQKRLKQETQKRREYRANEYNAVAYGGLAYHTLRATRGNASMTPQSTLEFQHLQAARGNPLTTPHSAAHQRQSIRLPLEPKPANLSYSGKAQSVNEQASMPQKGQVVADQCQTRVKSECASHASSSESAENESPGPTSPTIAYGDKYSATVLAPARQA